MRTDSTRAVTPPAPIQQAKTRMQQCETLNGGMQACIDRLSVIQTRGLSYDQQHAIVDTILLLETLKAELPALASGTNRD